MQVYRHGEQKKVKRRNSYYFLSFFISDMDTLKNERRIAHEIWYSKNLAILIFYLWSNNEKSCEDVVRNNVGYFLYQQLLSFPRNEGSISCPFKRKEELSSDRQVQIFVPAFKRRIILNVGSWMVLFK